MVDFGLVSVVDDGDDVEAPILIDVVSLEVGIGCSDGVHNLLVINRFFGGTIQRSGTRLHFDKDNLVG